VIFVIYGWWGLFAFFLVIVKIVMGIIFSRNVSRAYRITHLLEGRKL
jgi:hypothetical protein